jgi:predicted house-cleaning noncanonical NTP pyrophosphatase (MazG superfamily)
MNKLIINQGSHTRGHIIINLKDYKNKLKNKLYEDDKKIRKVRKYC